LDLLQNLKSIWQCLILLRVYVIYMRRQASFIVTSVDSLFSLKAGVMSLVTSVNRKFSLQARRLGD
jgi:hypothetical protein